MNAAAAPSANAPRERLVHVIQGEFAVSDDPRVVLTTILGSCVATCIWDPVIGVGGMNHFLLPGEKERGGDLMRYGVNAMELLINGLLQRNASRARLQAKCFGGAHVINNLSDVGAQNASFALRFLEAEKIPCAAQSLGGDKARRVRFWPSTGRAGQLLIDGAAPELRAVTRARPEPPPNPAAGSIEFF